MNSYYKTVTSILKGRLPGQLVIQTTERCNAKCPQCGMNISNSFKRSTLSSEKIHQAIDRAAELNFQSVSFTGGEPFLIHDDIMNYIKYASVKGIKYTRTGTNGFMFQKHNEPGYTKKIHALAGQLSQSGIYTFWISIDSACPDTHEKMRGLPGVTEGIKKALKIFAEYKIYPSANLGINRNTGGRDTDSYLKYGIFQKEMFYESFAEKFRKFYKHVINMGFTIANACYPMSFKNDTDTSVYTATSSENITSFTVEEKTALFSALADVIPEFRSKIRIFTPRSSLYSILCGLKGEKEKFPCHGGVDYFFLDSHNGETYPCGFRGTESLGPFHTLTFTENKTHCLACDWECFRDPSSLFAPFLSFKNFRKLIRDKTQYTLWKEDLSYFRNCSFFNCRKNINTEKLSSSKKPSNKFMFRDFFLS